MREANKLADALAELLKAKMPNGSYILRKENRMIVIKTEIFLRGLK